MGRGRPSARPARATACSTRTRAATCSSSRGRRPTKDCYGLGPGRYHHGTSARQGSSSPSTSRSPRRRPSPPSKFTVRQRGQGRGGRHLRGRGAPGLRATARLATTSRAQDVALSPKYLKPNDKNNIVFDNLKNPARPRAVGHLQGRGRRAAAPRGSESELKEQAPADILNGDRFYQDRLICGPQPLQRVEGLQGEGAPCCTSRPWRPASTSTMW